MKLIVWMEWVIGAQSNIAAGHSTKEKFIAAHSLRMDGLIEFPLLTAFAALCVLRNEQI